MAETGRPTKYTEDAAMRLFQALARGDSVTQFAAQEGVSRSTVYKWADEHPVFSDALSRGQEASQAYWEGELRSMMYSREVNAPLVKLYFANRFGWSDKQDMNHSGKIEQPLVVVLDDDDDEDKAN